MKKNIKFFIYSLLLFALSSAHSVLAQYAPQTGGSSQIPNPLGGTSDIMSLINEIINFLLLIVSPIATIVVLYAGVLFMTSGGSVEKVDKAKKTLTYAVIGIAVLLVSKGVALVVASFLGGS